MHKRLLQIVLTVFVCLCSQVAHAQLTFVVNPQTQIAFLGQNLIFSGTLANQGDIELFLDAISVNFPDGAGNAQFTLLTGDEDPFLNGAVPFSLKDTGDVYNGDLFGLKIAGFSSAGAYSGVATITSHLEGQASFDTSQDFLVTISPTAAPEANSLLLLVSAIAFNVVITGTSNRLRRPRLL